jgi:hypothetical protein
MLADQINTSQPTRLSQTLLAAPTQATSDFAKRASGMEHKALDAQSLQTVQIVRQRLRASSNTVIRLRSRFAQW